MSRDPRAPSGFPEIVAGRYRLLRELGRGGMGAVYEAEHANTGERVALKTMLIGSDDKEFVERFRREARAFAKIGGEHVVRVIDADVAPELDGAPFLVMELLNGSDLSHMLETERRLSPDLVVKYLSQTGAAIERAHAAGLIHRDLKPENIFIHRTVEGREIVKVLDFGIAKAFEHTALTKPGALVGTPHYMAPEQARGETNAICPQTDVWALGMIAIELLTGEPFWNASSIVQLFTQIMTEPMGMPRARWPLLPRGFDAWFARSCAREIRLRWPSVREQMSELRLALRGRAESVDLDLTGVAPRQALVASTTTARLPQPVATAAAELPAPVVAPAIATVPLPRSAGVMRVPAPASVGLPQPITVTPASAPTWGPLLRFVGWAALASAFLAAGSCIVLLGLNRRPDSLPASALDAEPTARQGAHPDPPPPTATPTELEDSGVPDELSHNPYRSPSDGGGFLSINVYPWAKVSEGGRVLCAATPCNKIPLSPGSHTLLLENPEQGMKQSTTLTITSGETTTRAIGFK